MNSQLQQAFLEASGIDATHLNHMIRFLAGMIITVAAVFIIAGLMKLLEAGDADHQLRFILYLLGLSMTLMIFFTFVVG